MLQIKWLHRYQFCINNAIELQLLLAMIPHHQVTIDSFIWSRFPIYIVAHRRWFQEKITIVSFSQAQRNNMTVGFDDIPWLIYREERIPMDEILRWFENHKRSNTESKLDMTYMPTSIWPDYQWRVRTTKTQYWPGQNDYILNSKILPPMSYFNTAAVLNATAQSALKWKQTQSTIEVLEFKVRFGSSKKSIEMQMIREIPSQVDVDDVDFLIEEIF